MRLMDVLNDNLLNKYICSYIAMKYKYNLVKWVADKEIHLQFTTAVIATKNFWLDTFWGGHLLDLFIFCVICRERIEKNVDSCKSG